MIEKTDSVKKYACINKIKEVRQKQIIILLLSLLSFSPGMNLLAQDIHFSQFYASPMILNPAGSGMSGEGLRVANIYRNQWARIGIPYTSLSTSVDRKVTISGQSFGIGAFLVHDQSSSYCLSVDEFMFSVSYSRIIRNHQITIGLQPGYGYKSYNAQNLTFSSQFNEAVASFDPTLPSLEEGLGDRLSYFDLSAGIAWRTMIGNIVPSAGFSVNHLNMPLQQFSNSSMSTRLSMRFNVSGGVLIPLNSKVALNPAFIYSCTPGTNEFLVGGTTDYSIGGSGIPVQKVYTVSMIRINPTRTMDAVIIGGGVEFLNFNLGLTYDLNISSLSKVTDFNGAFEATLVFTGRGHVRNNTGLPCYILN